MAVINGLLSSSESANGTRVLIQILFIVFAALIGLITASVATASSSMGKVNNNDLSPGDLFDALSGDKRYYRGVSYEFETSAGGVISRTYVDIFTTETELAIQTTTQKSGSSDIIATSGAWWRYGEDYGDCYVESETEPMVFNVTYMANFCESSAAANCELQSKSSSTMWGFAYAFLWLTLVFWIDFSVGGAGSPATSISAALLLSILAFILMVCSMATFDNKCVDEMLSYLSSNMKSASGGGDLGVPVMTMGKLLEVDAASIALSLIYILLLTVIVWKRLWEPPTGALSRQRQSEDWGRESELTSYKKWRERQKEKDAGAVKVTGAKQNHPRDGASPQIHEL